MHHVDLSLFVHLASALPTPGRTYAESLCLSAHASVQLPALAWLGLACLAAQPDTKCMQDGRASDSEHQTQLCHLLQLSVHCHVHVLTAAEMKELCLVFTMQSLRRTCRLRCFLAGAHVHSFGRQLWAVVGLHVAHRLTRRLSTSRGDRG